MALVNAFGAPLDVVPANITGKFREAFETFTNGVNWNLTQDSNDIVLLDGNAASASYLAISKDPLTVGGITTLETIATYTFPFEVAVGLSMSQRTLGQELSVELVSTETPLDSIADIAISSISQTTTTLTVTTSSAHGLVAGKRIGIYGVTGDSRLNYPSLVVASTPSPTQFTCTGGPGGTIASVTTGPFTNQGFVFFRPALNYAKNGMSQIFENNNAGNASFYTRSSAGDALPSGTVSSNHTVTTASTTGTTAVSAAYNYAFLPATEFRFIAQADRVQFMDVAVDSSSAPSHRLLRTQVVPDPSKEYKLRFRFTNNKSLPIPTAKITSAVKSASATATITTQAAHGLTTGDFVTIYGIGDTTNFPNVTTSTQVLSTPTSTTFTVTIGTSATATSAGGFVSRSQGSQAIQNVSTVAAQQCTVTATQLQLTGIGTWTGFAIGDYVNVHGVRNRATGADLGVDGAYKVVDIQTSNVFLEPIGNTTLPATMSAVNCGGAIIRRTDARIAFVRIFDYVRQRVEVLNNGAAAGSVPVTVQNNPVIGGGSIASQSTANTLVADITSAALTSTATSSTITPGSGCVSSEYNVIVTAVSGTNPTLDVVVQESDDSGTNWYDVYHFPRITATGQYRSPLVLTTGNRVRYVRTVGGTSPSFTNAVNRVQSNASAALQKQFIAYAAGLTVNTLNAVTTSYFTDGCTDFNIAVSMGAVTTTAPVLVLEQSMDNTNWVQVGADITTAANTNNLLQVSNALGRFTRIRVKTAGSGATLNFVMVKGIGR